MRKRKGKARSSVIALRASNVVIKRRGHPEKYDKEKVFKSALFACKNAHLSEKRAKEIALKVTKEVTNFVLKAERVTSDVIFNKINKELQKHDKDAAFLYETHKDLS